MEFRMGDVVRINNPAAMSEAWRTGTGIVESVDDGIVTLWHVENRGKGGYMLKDLTFIFFNKWWPGVWLD